MSSSDGRPIKVEDLTDDRDSSREPDEATASEHGTDGPESSYHSADEQAAEDGLPLGERFPSPRTIEAGLQALAGGQRRSLGVLKARGTLASPHHWPWTGNRWLLAVRICQKMQVRGLQVHSCPEEARPHGAKVEADRCHRRGDSVPMGHLATDESAVPP